ncbi:MAG TPA: S-adenosylmethionine:tRNA ribosyltransferase-isomerase [Edaphocola sp.]|nr:S-adenosylmethionine:tRNA ribosyltransferase-isomerase [Edaphocola sp.]
MHPKDIKIEEFSYPLPEEKIAKFPVINRDEAKLLVYKNGMINDFIFNEIVNFIPEKTLLIFNETKVVYARLLMHKETGGKVEVFCLEPDDRYSDIPTAMANKGEVHWKCLLGGGSKWKAQQSLFLEDETLTLNAERAQQFEGGWIIRLFWNDDSLSFAEVLERLGNVPLPPYLKRETIETDKQDYQSIFAKEEGSVAAPTASLHFTEKLVQSLKQKGVNFSPVTLHVGAGTFKPVSSDTMEGHLMHSEWIELTIEQLRTVAHQLEQKENIIAVGTTSCRTLESLYWIGLQLHNGISIENGNIAVHQWLPYEHKYTFIEPHEAIEAIINDLKQKNENKLIVKTQIIIAPGYSFKIINGLITNFHQPQSTLLLLVAAMLGEDWHKIYDHALKNDYRFLSYGDGSLLWLNNNEPL